MNRRIAATAIAVVVVGACSGDDGAVSDATSSAAIVPISTGAGGSAGVATTSAGTHGSVGSPTTTADIHGSAGSPTTTNAAPATASVTAAETIASEPGSPAVGEANGWRFVLIQPLSHSTIGAEPLMCYEVSGTSREPSLVLDVQVIDVATAAVVIDELREIDVGRGSIELDLSALAPGRYDLVAGLSVDDAPASELALQIGDLALVPGTTAVSCP